MMTPNKILGIKKLDMSKPFLGVVGCSYTHWADGECFGHNYPAFVAKDHPEYNVIDLSAPGSSNDSAYFRLFHFEKLLNIKFAKVIFQITHFGRELVFGDWDWNALELWREGLYVNDNLVYTKGEFVDSLNVITATIEDKHAWSKHNRQWLQKFFMLRESMLASYYTQKFTTDEMVWKVQKEINLINAMYGIDNVLIFPWHRNIDSTNPSRRKNLKIFLPDNIQPSIEELLGHKRFRKLGIDDAPHYNARGQAEVYRVLEPRIDSLLKK